MRDPHVISIYRTSNWPGIWIVHIRIRRPPPVQRSQLSSKVGAEKSHLSSQPGDRDLLSAVGNAYKYHRKSGILCAWLLNQLSNLDGKFRKKRTKTWQCKGETVPHKFVPNPAIAMHGSFLACSSDMQCFGLQSWSEIWLCCKTNWTDLVWLKYCGCLRKPESKQELQNN